MSKNTKFKPGQSGNPKTRFQPGNAYRWQPGQSGNPAGVARSRVAFEQAFYSALIGEGAPEEAANLLWQCAREREPWAVQALLQRLAPPMQHIRVIDGGEDEQRIDYSRLTDSELEQLETLVRRAATPVAEPESGEGPTALS